MAEGPAQHTPDIHVGTKLVSDQKRALRVSSAAWSNPVSAHAGHPQSVLCLVFRYEHRINAGNLWDWLR